MRREHITSERRGYIIKTISADQFSKLIKLTKILNATCTTSDNSPILRNYNSTNGLIFITEFNVDDTESLQTGLRNKYNVAQVQQAFWIKLKNEKSIPFLVRFA